MINLSPTWILSLLSAENHHVFDEVINQQFEAFTKNELGLEPTGVNKWWGIKRVSSPVSVKLNHGIPKELQQVYPEAVATAAFRQNSITIVLYTELDTIAHLKNLIGCIINTIPDDLIYHIYTIIADQRSQKTSELIDELFRLGAETSSYGSIVLMDDSNIDDSNTNGFRDLYNGDKALKTKVYAISSQIIMNLAIGHDNLCGKNRSSNVYAAGGFSTVFENDVYKSKLAYKHLTKPALYNFFNNDESPWKNTNQIAGNLQNDVKSFSAKEFYRKAVHVFSDKFEEINTFFRPKTSPWALFSLSLLPNYFKYELKLLLKKLVEYGRILDMRIFSQYEKHLKGKLKVLLNETRELIHNLASSLWANCNIKKQDPVGLKQFIYNLSLIKDELMKAKTVFAENKDEYYKIYSENEPVVAPDPIYDEYKKITSTYVGPFMANDLSEAEADPRKEEEGMLNLLRKKLELHPVPLSLLVRAAVLGIVLSVVSFKIIELISDSLLNTTFFVKEGESGRYIWLFGIFAIVVIGAIIIKYGILTLKKIKTLKAKYLAWVFHRIQLRLVEYTSRELIPVVDELIQECETIEAKVKELIVSFQSTQQNNVDLENYDLSHDDIAEKIVTKEHLYPINHFQQSVFDPIDQTSKLNYVNLDDLNTEIKLSPTESVSLNFDDSDEQVLYRTLAKIFTEERFYEKFYDALLEGKAKDILINQFQQEMEKFIETSINSIDEFTYANKGIEVYISRSYPSGYRDTAEGVAKTCLTIAVEDNVWQPLGDILHPRSDVSIVAIPVTATPPHDANLKMNSIRQLCQYYRLTGKNDVIIPQQNQQNNE